MTSDTLIESYEGLVKEFKFIRTKLEQGKKYQLIFKDYKANKSRAQEKTYHMWFNEINKQVFEAHGVAYGVLGWKEYFKERYLWYVQGPKTQRLISTKELKVGEAAEWMEKIIAECSTGLDLNNELKGMTFNLTMPGEISNRDGG